MKPPVLLCIAFVVIFFGCSHKKDLATPVPVYDFSYSGSLVVGDTISFVSTAPATSTFLWKFGDGGTSVLAAPMYVYSTIRSNEPNPYLSLHGFETLPDSVSLIINNDSLHPIIKSLWLNPPVRKIAGTYNWRHYYYSQASSGGLQYTYEPDTTISITFVDSMHVGFGGYDLGYIPGTAWAFGCGFAQGMPSTSLVCDPTMEYFSIITNLDPSAHGGNGPFAYEAFAYP